MDHLVIRRSKLGDITSVQRIYAYHVRKGLGSFEEIAPPVSEIKRRCKEVLDLGLPYFVAEVDGVVIGYSYATLYRERSGYRYTLEDSVYVDLVSEERASAALCYLP
jgi:phosphinothricin acetyltransferase